MCFLLHTFSADNRHNEMRWFMPVVHCWRTYFGNRKHGVCTLVGQMLSALRVSNLQNDVIPS